ncbi:MAG TPA: hypothetical protein PKC24_08350 [Cyclobacteriaceae bacterium]|nr:hypothetical protein [Cyclobacteriaceae bacterium]
MKMFSFLRTPKPQRFSFTSRYYDPVKEELKERTARIKAELEAKESGDYSRATAASRLRGSFKDRRPTSVNKHSNILQSIILLLLVALILGYLEFGNSALYLSLLIIPVYFYFRFKKNK